MLCFELAPGPNLVSRHAKVLSGIHSLGLKVVAVGVDRRRIWVKDAASATATKHLFHVVHSDILCTGCTVRSVERGPWTHVVKVEVEGMALRHSRYWGYAVAHLYPYLLLR